MFLLWFQFVGYVGYDDRIFFLPDASSMTELDNWKANECRSFASVPCGRNGGMLKDSLETNLRGRKFTG